MFQAINHVFLITQNNNLINPEYNNHGYFRLFIYFLATVLI